MTDPVDLVRALLAGLPGGEEALAPAVRAEAFGAEAFGALAVAELFALDPVSLSPRPHVVRTAEGMALFEADADGGGVAVFADLFDGVIGRLWRLGAAGAGAHAAPAEPAAAVAFDPFLSQARDGASFCGSDLRELDPAGQAALEEVVKRVAANVGLRGSRVLVARAFGAGEGAAALLVACGVGARHRYIAVAFRYDSGALLHLQAVEDVAAGASAPDLLGASAFMPNAPAGC